MLNPLSKEAVMMYYRELMEPKGENHLYITGTNGSDYIIADRVMIRYWHNNKLTYEISVMGNYELFD